MDVTGALDSAVTALQSLLAEYPDDSWATNNLGVAYEMSGERERDPVDHLGRLEDAVAHREPVVESRHQRLGRLDDRAVDPGTHRGPFISMPT